MPINYPIVKGSNKKMKQLDETCITVKFVTDYGLNKRINTIYRDNSEYPKYNVYESVANPDYNDIHVFEITSSIIPQIIMILS